MRKNPAIWISLIGALLLMAVGFGLKLSGAQVDSILTVAGIAVPLIMGGAAVAIRSQVYSPDSAQTALNMPAGSSVSLLNKVIAADVKVVPGDTQAVVVNKVAVAS